MTPEARAKKEEWRRKVKAYNDSLGKAEEPAALPVPKRKKAATRKAAEKKDE